MIFSSNEAEIAQQTNGRKYQFVCEHENECRAVKCITPEMYWAHLDVEGWHASAHDTPDHPGVTTGDAKTIPASDWSSLITWPQH